MRYAWLAMALLLFTGCSGIQVSQDYDPATPFDTLRTYRWATSAQPKSGDLRIDNPLRDKRIRVAVDRVLAARGLAKVDGNTSGFTVQYQYTLRRKIDTSGSSVGFGIGSYGRRSGIAIGTSTGDDIRQIDEGSLVIDLLDPTSGELLWRGTGTQRYREYDDPDRVTADIDALVDHILEQFPPD